MAVCMAAGTILSFAAPDASVKFADPSLARIIFWHLPCAILSSICFFAGPICGVAYLRTKKDVWDVRAESFMELGAILGILTLVTGMLFAKVEWGEWWNWDPRQTSFLLVMLIISAYLVLRAAFSERSTRAANSSAYAAASLLPNIFLLFVFPRLPQVLSLHPNLLQKNGGLGATYGMIFSVMILLVGAVVLSIYKLRVRAGLIEIALEESNAKLADRNRASTARVAGPMVLPRQD